MSKMNGYCYVCVCSRARAFACALVPVYVSVGACLELYMHTCAAAVVTCVIPIRHTSLPGGTHRPTSESKESEETLFLFLCFFLQ